MCLLHNSAYTPLLSPLRRQNMKDQSKTKSQLIEELCELRHRVEVLSGQQQSEKDLRAGEWAGEQLYRALVEHIDAVFWISTPGVSKQLYVSPSYEKIWGRPLEEVLRVPRTFVDSIHPDDKESFLYTLEKYHARGKSYEQEYRIVRPDGQELWIHEHGYPFRAKRGGPKLMLGICTDVTKQKENESQLRRSERRLSRAQKIAHIGDWEWDVISGEVYWSEEVIRIFKLPRQKPSFQLVHSIVHPEDLDEWENLVQDAVKRARPLRMDYRVLRPDGSVRWVHIDSDIVKDSAGAAVRFVGTVQDITARKQAESHLALFKTIAETSRIAIAISGPDGRLIYANPAHRRLFGRSLKEALNLNYRAYYPPESVAVLDRVVAPALARGEDWEGVLDALDARGRRFPLWERASTVRDAKGKMVCAYGFMRDYSERQATAEALAASEARYRSLVETSSAAVVSVDRESRITFANRRACEMVGVSEGELLGRVFVDFLHPDDLEGMLGAFERRFRDQRVEQNVEFRIVRKDGEIVECLSAPTVIWDGETVLGFNAIVQDITELKKTQEALGKSEREFRELFNNSTVGIFRTRLDGSGVLNVNEEFLRIFGRRREEVIGRPSLILWADPRDRTEMIRQLKKDGRVVDFECRMLHKSGEVRTCMTSLSLNREEAILNGSILDLTEHKRAEEELRESDRKYQTLFESMAEGAFYQLADGRVVDCNAAVLSMFGLTRRQFLGKTSMDLNWNVIHEDGSEFPGNRHPSMEALQTGKPIRGMVAGVFNPRKKDYVWLSITAIPEFRPGEDRPYQVFVTLHNITHRKRLEEEISRQRDRAQLYLEFAGVMILTLDLKGKVTLINREGCKILGCDREEIIGKNWFENFIPKRFREELKEYLSTVVQGQENSSAYHENFVIRADNTERCLSWRNHVIRDAKGNAVELLSSGSDITERRKAELKLERTNRALRVISRCNRSLVTAEDEASWLNELCWTIVEEEGFRMSWVGYAEHDEGKRVRPAAHAGFEEGYLETLDITWADEERGRGPTGTAIRTGKPVIARNIPEDPAFEPWRQAAIKRGYASSIALPLIAGGTTLGALNVYAAEPDAFDAEEVELLLQLAWDLAYGIQAFRARVEREQVAKALQESEERFRKIFYEGSIGIVLTGRDRKFFSTNPAFCHMLGYTEEELKSMTFLDVTHPAHRIADRENVEKLWRGEIRSYRTQKRYFTKNGNLVWGSLSVSLIRGRDEEPLYALAMVVEITIQKQAEEELRALSQQLSRAQESERERIARELHDQMGQSLTALSIGLTAERNARAARAPEASPERLDDCLHIVDALGQYTEDLMCELRPPVLDDYGLVSALRWYAERFEALTGASVFVECGEEPQRLTKEVETGLFRIAQEALTNVARHAEAESVRIGVECTSEGLTLSVADDGKGFERGETDTGETGRRWGLTIMRERARSLGGELLVESEPGKGTCVTVKLRVGRYGEDVL
jgi:PAS domain S-box-containing protein